MIFYIKIKFLVEKISILFMILSKMAKFNSKSVLYALNKPAKFTNLLTGRLLLLCDIFKEYWYERQNYHSRLAGS